MVGMEDTMLQWIVGQAGIAGLAMFTMVVLRAIFQNALQREREYAEMNREDKRRMLEVLSENTAALTKLTDTIESMTHGYDRANNPRSAT